MPIKRLSHKTLSLLCALAACGGPSPVPVDDWRSTLGRADIRFVEKDSGTYVRKGEVGQPSTGKDKIPNTSLKSKEK